MKKIISVFLAASLIASSVGVLPETLTTKATTKTADTNASITNLDKYENNDIIIVYKKNANATKKKTLSICGLSDSAASNADVSKLTDNSVVLKLNSDEELTTAIDTLSQDSRIDYIQPNYIYRLCDTDVNTVYSSLSKNADFSKQWGLYNDGTLTYSENSSTSFWGRPNQTTIQATTRMDIGLPEAWNICDSPKREVIVSIVDTGVMYDHEDLSKQMWTNPDEIPGDGIDNDGNGHIDDIHGWNFYDESVYNTGSGYDYYTSTPSPTPITGDNRYYNKTSNIEDSHGTHGAGTIAASNNNIGTVGIASNANVKIMSVKALGGDEGYGTTESVIQGIQYSEENGAHICNLSLGGEEDDAALSSVIENSSMLFTIAAGNGDYYTGRAVNTDKSPTYPASYNFPNIITVANLQCNGQLHSSSNYGATSVDLAAPGSYVYSTSTGDGTYNSYTVTPASSGYEYMTGTSMAAPMVAGVAAMLYSCYDNLSLQDVKNIIMNSVTPLDTLSGKCVSQGTLNAYAAVQLAENNNPSASVKPTSTVSYTTSTPSITASPDVTISPKVTATPNRTFLPTKTVLPTQTPIETIKPTPSMIPIETPSSYPFTTQKPVYTNTPIKTSVPLGPTLPTFATETPTSTITPTSKPVITAPPIFDFLTIDKLTISGGNTHYIGINYTITPKVSGGNGNYQYRYLISKKGKKYVNKNFSSSSSIKWKPTSPGDYQIQLLVKDSNGYNDYYSTQIHISNLKIKSLKANKTIRTGNAVKFTAKANYGIGTLTYQFTLKNTKNTYSRTQSSKKNNFVWKITKKGTYKLTLQITDSKKNTVKKTYTFKVKK